MKELEIDYKFRWRILSLFSHKKNVAVAVADFGAHPTTEKARWGAGDRCRGTGQALSPSLGCFQLGAENNNGTESSAHSPAVTAAIAASRCTSVRRFLMTFSLLLQKAKPESGITGKGEGEGAGDAAPGGSETAALGSL